MLGRRKMRGRHGAIARPCCSLNPVVHIDPIGTVVLPLLMIFSLPRHHRFMIGWAKPVPVNPYNLRIRAWTTFWFPWPARR